MTASAICVLGDRKHLQELRDTCRMLGGGGWTEGLQLFERATQFQYIALSAHERRRIERKAPAIILARDGETLKKAVSHICSQLDDVLCAWIYLVEADGRSVAEPIILADACTQGTA